MKKSIYPMIALLLGLLSFWGCTPSQPKKQVVVSAADLASSAWFQLHKKDTCISKQQLAELQGLRDAESTISSTLYSVTSLSLGRCCPCPPPPTGQKADSCQCDYMTRIYVSMPAWEATIALVNEMGVATALPTASLEGAVLNHILPVKFDPGIYKLKITGKFDLQNISAYELEVSVDGAGKIYRTN